MSVVGLLHRAAMGEKAHQSGYSDVFYGYAYKGSLWNNCCSIVDATKAITKFFAVPSGHTVECKAGFTSRELGIINAYYSIDPLPVRNIGYTEDEQRAIYDIFWQSSDPRSTNSVGYVAMTIELSEIDNAYMLDKTTGEYLFKGKNV